MHAAVMRVYPYSTAVGADGGRHAGSNPARGARRLSRSTRLGVLYVRPLSRHLRLHSTGIRHASMRWTCGLRGDVWCFQTSIPPPFPP